MIIKLLPQSIKKYFYLLLFIFYNSYSQNNNVTIIGEFPELKDGDTIKFSKSVGNYPDIGYLDSNDNVLVKKGVIKTKLKIFKEGLVSIYEPPYRIPSSSFFVEPNDTIIIKKINQDLVFLGNNELINNLLDKTKFLSPNSKKDFSLDEIIKNNKNSQDIINEINQHKYNLDKYYKSYLNENKISIKSYEFINNLIKQRIDFVMGLISSTLITNNEYKENLNPSIDSLDINNFLKEYTSKYSIFDKQNLNADQLLVMNIYNSALYNENLYKKQNNNISRFWNKYDLLFKNIITNFGVIDYIESEEYKEIYIANYILISIKYNSTANIEDLIPVYNDFKQKFPQSIYLEILKQKLFVIKKTENINRQKSSVSQNDFTNNLGLYDTNLGLLYSKIIFTENKSFEESLANQFKNNDVFIDFWATYCVPCIKEFPYNEELHNFLISKNIENLYVSIDNKESHKLWKKMVKDYNLKGYHFLASETYRKEKLIKIIQYVPRYFIFNSKTKKITKIDGFPHEKDSFYKKIIESLK